MLDDRKTKTYMVLTSLVICGLAVATVGASKIVHFGLNFPFSNVVYAIFSYPIVDCICELWGKKVAIQTVLFALFFQLLIVLLLQLSIVLPYASFWHHQAQYQMVLSVGWRVVVASFLAFVASQLLDVFIYQKIKRLTKGKNLWLRTNVSTVLGQLVDSSIFIFIVFYASNHKLSIFLGSFVVKIIISILMTPIAYAIVISVNRYLNSETMAFKPS